MRSPRLLDLDQPIKVLTFILIEYYVIFILTTNPLDPNKINIYFYLTYFVRVSKWK
jgi:hypothetical protein